MATKKVSPKKVGERIRQIRGSMPQKKFARAVRVGQQNYISRYESGRIPGPDLLVRIAAFGNTSVDWILTGEHFRPTPAPETPAPELKAV